MHISRRAFLAGLAGSSIAPDFAFGSGLQIVSGAAFGSRWRVVFDGPTDPDAVWSSLTVVFDHINAQMSPYLPGSNLSQFNALPSVDWQWLPPELYHVASKALQYSHLTNGAFDPTVGPLVSRYGFGPIKGARGKYTDIGIRQNAIRKSAPRLTLDLCGIAKGFALDEAVKALGRMGVANALVDVGGETRAVGQHPDKRPWHVAIADPLSADFQVYRIMVPGQLALATSGRAVNGLSDPVSTSHIINPGQGAPASSRLGSVSVLASSGIKADALATALCAVGPEMGVRLAEALDISALFIMDEAQPSREVMTRRFADYVLI